ncbi:MAG: chemotaxis protein CheX [Hyphomicrobiales bacterium]|nr:MAG: chemotaxis protein CheX [Hyphomicrobiales bacterium]
MSDEITKFELPESSASENAGDLTQSLLNLRGQHLVIDASSVGRIDTPCLQVLLGTAKQWVEDGVKLTLEAPSEVFENSISLLGLTLEQFETEGGQNV